MPITEVGGGSQRATKGGSTSDPDTLAFPGNVTSGNLLIVAGCQFKGAGGAAAPAITDTVGTSYSVLSGQCFSGNNGRLFIGYGIAAASGANTVSVNFDNLLPGHSWSIDEFTGNHGTPLDVDGGVVTNTTGTAVPIDTIVTTTPNALIIGVMGHDGTSGTAITPGTGYTQIGEEESNAQQDHAAEFQIVTSSKLYIVNWTLASSQPWGVYVASFKPADGTSGAGDPCEHYQLEDGSGVYLLEHTSGGYLLEGSAPCGGGGGLIFNPAPFQAHLVR